MGMADTVPGISGGTIALITGIYDKLIHSLANLNATFILDALKGDWKAARKDFSRIDLAFFIPLGIGIVSAILLMSGVISFLLDTYPSSTYSFFFGLILASAIILFRKIKKISTPIIISFVVGLMIAFLIAGLGATEALGHSYPIIFLAGAIAVCAMVLPGISGAFLLLLLGQYEFFLNTLHDLKSSLFSGGSLISELLIIMIAGLGGLTGILLFSRFLDRMLKEHKATTLSFLTGLMVGSLRLPAMKIIFGWNLWLLLYVAVGFFIVLFLEGFFKKR